MDQYYNLQKYFHILKKGPQTPCDCFGMVVWLALGLKCLYHSNGMVRSDLVLEREGYGMGFPSHGVMELVWDPYTTLEWGTLKVR